MARKSAQRKSAQEICRGSPPCPRRAPGLSPPALGRVWGHGGLAARPAGLLLLPRSCPSSPAPSHGTHQEQESIHLGPQKAFPLSDLQPGPLQAVTMTVPRTDSGTLGVPQTRWQFLPGKGSSFPALVVSQPEHCSAASTAGTQLCQEKSALCHGLPAKGKSHSSASCAHCHPENCPEQKTKPVLLDCRAR